MLPPIASFVSPKAVLREKMKAERRALARPDAGRHAARYFLDSLSVPEGAIVGLYHPIRDELDTGPLAEALEERGVALALPASAAKNAPLEFRRWRPGEALRRGAHGTKVPAAEAGAVSPGIVVVPLLAFTRSGDRLGYGGGYYDRTLAAMREAGAVIAVGYGYGAQEVDALPSSPLDQPLDWIVTERGAFQARADAALRARE